MLSTLIAKRKNVGLNSETGHREAGFDVRQLTVNRNADAMRNNLQCRDCVYADSCGLWMFIMHLNLMNKLLLNERKNK